MAKDPKYTQIVLICIPRGNQQDGRNLQKTIIVA